MSLHVQQSYVARREGGYAMAALLISIAVLGVLSSAAMPVWRQAAQREKEAELVFRGEQYARAVDLYQRKFAGAFPSSIDLLVDQKFLRREYKDPMTEAGEFQILYQTSQLPGSPEGEQEAGQDSTPTRSPTLSGSGSETRSPGAAGTPMGPRGGVLGVVSKSEEPSIRLYNGRDHYDEWVFVFTAATAQAGTVAPGGQGAERPGLQQGPSPSGQGRGGQGPGGFGPAGLGPGSTSPGGPGAPSGSRPNSPLPPGAGTPPRR